MADLRDDFEYQRALRDCAEKLAALPGRLKAEFDAALEERREPFNIEPITLIRADLVCRAIEAIKDPTGDLKEICKVQARSCKSQGKAKVGLLSEQLAAILAAAGIALKEPIVAPVQG